MKKKQSIDPLVIKTGGIAHDFNNLLVTIIGNAELAFCKIKPDSPAYSHLVLIKMAANRASELTSQLISHTRTSIVMPHEVNLDLVVEEMLSLLKVSIPKQVAITFHRSAQNPVVLMDEIRAHQIIMNLITNAVDAIGLENGEITMKTGILEQLPEHLPGNGGCPHAFFEITDTGCGISDECRKKIFDPLFTTKPHGKGLGLVVVKEHIMSNNGHITVSSIPEKGSTFTVYLPAADRNTATSGDAEKAPSVETNRELYSGTILVIDDEPDVLETTAAMMHEAGFTVLASRSGEEGLMLLERNRNEIDLVILDMVMPSMNGDDVLRGIRDMRGDLPVILTSGYRKEDVDAQLLAEAGMYLQKPYHMDALIQAVARCMRKN